MRVENVISFTGNITNATGGSITAGVGIEICNCVTSVPRRHHQCGRHSSEQQRHHRYRGQLIRHERRRRHHQLRDDFSWPRPAFSSEASRLHRRHQNSGTITASGGHGIFVGGNATLSSVTISTFAGGITTAERSGAERSRHLRWRQCAWAPALPSRYRASAAASATAARSRRRHRAASSSVANASGSFASVTISNFSGGITNSGTITLKPTAYWSAAIPPALASVMISTFAAASPTAAKSRRPVTASSSRASKISRRHHQQRQDLGFADGVVATARRAHSPAISATAARLLHAVTAFLSAAVHPFTGIRVLVGNISNSGKIAATGAASSLTTSGPSPAASATAARSR